MIKILVLAFLAAFCTAPSWADDGYAYFFGGFGSYGGNNLTTHLGGGVEKVFRNFGISCEGGYLAAAESMGEGVGTLNVNGAYHFLNESRRWRPFVTGGYTLFFREGTANLWNFGGGIQYWIAPRKGIRFDFRDMVQSEFGSSYHYPTFRVGFVTRF